MRTTLAFLALAIGWQSTLALDWPQWRGPNRTGISAEKGLLKQWPQGGPKRLWINSQMGNGYSSFAIAKGKLYTMGSRRGTEQLICLDANTGREQWAANLGPELSNGWGGGPRGTPTVDGNRVYAMSGKGDLVCADLAGKIQWQASMTRLGGKTPVWGYTESITVDGNLALATPGGRQGAVVAFNKLSGQVVWQSKQFTDGAQYASVVPVTHNGARQYIQLTQQSLVGLDARTGNVLWKSGWGGKTAVIPTPIFSNGKVYIASGYGAGSKLVNVGAGNRASDVWSNKVMKNHHGGVIMYGQHLYGYSDGAGWVCQDFASGREVWSEKRALGKGCLTIADGMMYCVDESRGDIVLAAANPRSWNESGRFRLAPQSRIRSSRGKIWSHPVVANGKLYLRDQEHIYCHTISAGGGGAAITPTGPPGKAIAWTAGVDTKSIDAIYQGKAQAVVTTVFGQPAKTQGTWKAYSGLNITDRQGKKYGTVWFNLAGGTVQQVRFDK
ncbi:MAG: PQQ-like beta-propeller repeat protein [Verrucomicrobia subdivision 3 bacterium]|nr:PQQ-like beta-propeller repeat protein [Limisphaerales bacterium]